MFILDIINTIEDKFNTSLEFIGQVAGQLETKWRLTLTNVRKLENVSEVLGTILETKFCTFCINLAQNIN